MHIENQVIYQNNFEDTVAFNQNHSLPYSFLTVILTFPCRFVLLQYPQYQPIN